LIQDIHLPEINMLKQEGNIGIFTIEPLYPGYGMTLGNSLRRVILSSLPGAAVTAVKIDGVTHEFTTIPHIKEDVVEIILNLKQIRVRSYSDEEQYLYLSFQGEGKVTAGHIQSSSQVEIINKDLHIATLDNSKARLEMELKIERGRGYVPVEKRDGERLQVGMIAIDAIYTPIKKVRYNVESTRVGQMTDLDKLIIEIETDGTITPKGALMTASDILVDHFMIIVGKNMAKTTVKEVKPEKNPEDAAAKILVEEVNLSPRTTNALLNNDIKTIADILILTDDELKNLKGFGNKAYQEVREKLDELGFNFETSGE